MSQADKDKIRAYKIKHHKLPQPPQANATSLMQKPGDAKDLEDEEEDDSLANIKLKQQERKKQEAGFVSEVEKLHSLQDYDMSSQLADLGKDFSKSQDTQVISHNLFDNLLEDTNAQIDAN